MRFFFFVAAAIATAAAAAATNSSLADYNALFPKAQEHYDWMVQFRRSVHAEPELGLHTFKTAQKVKDELRRMGIFAQDNWCRGPGMEKGAGLVFDIGTGSSPVVLLRADMDALPIVEDNELEFKSKIHGAMHACGHDSHTTMLLGAARLLKPMEKEIPGTIRFMFQPGEEGFRGALYMINEGVLTMEPPVDRALALHVVPLLPTGIIETGRKTVLAGGTDFEIEITGLGGHAGAPAKTRDPIVAGAALVQGFQSIVARETLGLSARKVGLISTTLFQAGTTHNVIPGTVRMAGTARAVHTDTLKTLFKRMEEMTESVAKAYNVDIKLTWVNEPLPPLNISPIVRDEMQNIVDQATAFPFKYPEGEFSYGMEDFAFISDRVPTAMYAIGTGSGRSTKNSPPTNANVHDPKFVLDETILPQGSAFLASGALNLLDKLNAAAKQEAAAANSNSKPSKSEL